LMMMEVITTNNKKKQRNNQCADKKKFFNTFPLSRFFEKNTPSVTTTKYPPNINQVAVDETMFSLFLKEKSL
jgi:hypothetical protein